MARANFGGGTADFVYGVNPTGFVKLQAATLTVWDAETGGTRITDLLVGGVAATSVAVDGDGQVPTFQGPDGVYAVWVDAGGPERSLLAADVHQTAAATAAAASAAQASAAAAEAAAEALETVDVDGGAL